MRAVLAGEVEKKEMALDAVNRRGKKIKCHIGFTPLLTGKQKRRRDPPHGGIGLKPLSGGARQAMVHRRNPR